MKNHPGMKKDIARFSVCREPRTKAQRKDINDIWPFFCGLQLYTKVDDVRFGQDPPDFIITQGEVLVGAEVTKINPRKFGPRGFKLKGDYAAFKDTKEDGRFNWGRFTMNEVLVAWEEQVKRKEDRT